ARRKLQCWTFGTPNQPPISVIGCALPVSFQPRLQFSMRTSSSLQRQLPLGDVCPVTEAVGVLSLAGVEERGAIFTRREVVEFMLDLIRYTPDRPLHTMRLLEPSFGDGDFLLPVIDRLLAAAERAKVKPSVKTLGPALFAVELHTVTHQSTKTKVIDKLV